MEVIGVLEFLRSMLTRRGCVIAAPVDEVDEEDKVTACNGVCGTSTTVRNKVVNADAVGRCGA